MRSEADMGCTSRRQIIALRAKGSSNGGLFQIMIKDQLLFFLLLAAVKCVLDLRTVL